MPLDPYFRDRLRTHRTYLVTRFVRSLRDRMLAPFRPRRAALAGTAAAASGTTSASSASSALSVGARLRRRHRKAALAWDRTEFETVSTPGPDIPTEEHLVPVAGYPPVRVRIYRPRVPSRAPSPAVLAFFGGAFRIGGIDYPTTDALCRRRAADAAVAVVAVDYSLAPEHKYPTQIEQGHAALAWLFERADELGIDAQRVGITGTSAGGAIAAAVTLLNRERTRLPLRLQLLEVPVLDLTGRHVDLRATWAIGVPGILVLREMVSVARTYLPRLSDARLPLVSPLRADTHAGLPPAVILTAQYDPLRGDGAAYGAALRAAGVPASVVMYLGVTHDTPIFSAILAAAERWHGDVVSALRSLHG